MMLNPICVSQPCSLTERKKSRVGSVVMPYILSSTLRRMSTVSTLSNASSGLSSGSASSDGPSCISSQESVFPPLPLPLVFLSHRLLLCCHHYTLLLCVLFLILLLKSLVVFMITHLSVSSFSPFFPSRLFTNSSLLSRPSDRRTSMLSRSEEDNRIARKNRKEWSVSKSQVLLERPSDADEVRSHLQVILL